MKPLVGYEWPQGGTKQVAYMSQDHHIHEFYVGVGGEWQHANLMTLAGAPIAKSRFFVGFAWPEEGTKQVAYLGPGNHIHELRVSVGGTWQHTNLSLITSAPPAIQVCAGYSWAEGRSKQIVFMGDDTHIHELCLEAGKSWRHVDLTDLTNAPLPGNNRMIGYGWSAGRSKQVTYVGQDGHIHELCLVSGGMWQHTNLSAQTNAPRAVEVKVGFEWPEGQCKQIAFVSEDGHIHELYQSIGKPWTHTDLHTMIQTPPATNVITGYAWAQGQSKQIAYVGQDGHIHELAVAAGGGWQHTDLTTKTNAPITPITTIDGYAWSAGESKQVAYVGDDGEIRELWMPRGGSWVYANLSMKVIAIPARF